MGHASTVWDLAFNSAGDLLASCSDDCTLRIWHCIQSKESGAGSEMRLSLASTSSGYHTRTIFSVDWSASGVVATGSADNSICLFSVGEASENGGGGGGALGHLTCTLEYRQEGAHPCDVNCVRWNPKHPHLLASAGDDGVIKIWKYQQTPL